MVVLQTLLLFCVCKCHCQVGLSVDKLRFLSPCERIVLLVSIFDGFDRCLGILGNICVGACFP